jgi:hypothetical protein
MASGARSHCTRVAMFVVRESHLEPVPSLGVSSRGSGHSDLGAERGIPKAPRFVGYRRVSE